jgi:hypothetical protein
LVYYFFAILLIFFASSIIEFVCLRARRARCSVDLFVQFQLLIIITSTSTVCRAPFLHVAPRKTWCGGWGVCVGRQALQEVQVSQMRRREPASDPQTPTCLGRRLHSTLCTHTRSQQESAMPAGAQRKYLTRCFAKWGCYKHSPPPQASVKMSCSSPRALAPPLRLLHARAQQQQHLSTNHSLKESVFIHFALSLLGRAIHADSLISAGCKHGSAHRSIRHSHSTRARVRANRAAPAACCSPLSWASARAACIASNTQRNRGALVKHCMRNDRSVVYDKITKLGQRERSLYRQLHTPQQINGVNSQQMYVQLVPQISGVS